MPWRSCIGFAPAARLRRPSLTMAWASTVAVVVPSPATSLVLVAASLRSCAPMFSNGSSSEISLATVTPSWVTVGAPNFLSSATLRPLGPSVVLTAPARTSIPFLSERRACSSNSSCFAIIRLLLHQNGENVALAHHQIIFAIQLELSAAILGVEHPITNLNFHRYPVAVIQQLAAANGNN